MIKERLMSALIGTLLILAFQPFGLYAFGWMRWVLMAGITVCVFASCVLSEYVVRYVLRMPYNAESGMSYNMRRNMAFQIVNVLMMTASVSVFLHLFASNDKVDNHLSFSNVMVVFASFIGASVIIGLYWKNVYWKRHFMHQLADAQRLNGILEERNRQAEKKLSITTPTSDSVSAPSTETSTPSTDTPTEQNISNISSPNNGEVERGLSPQGEQEGAILLEGTTKENVSLCPSDFLYAESDGNYVTVHYMKDSDVRKSVLRTSIKSVVQSLCVHNSITQCHRAFVVNISYVSRVESRSSGIGLKLKRVPDVIPVSKSYVAEVKRLIQNPE